LYDDAVIKKMEGGEMNQGRGGNAMGTFRIGGSQFNLKSKSIK
jgi:hypothetical protein